uniref:Unkown protein n=1 Tax=Riptortus pedestris TaxID=329032 RepID=R4WNY2_RIPPE|nr:unkown protein [Riptortus pedestris]
MEASSENNDNYVAVRPLTNGTYLQKYTGKAVTLVGVVILVNPNGMSFDLKTPDLQIVTVQMRKPLKEPVSGLVEVQGIVSGRNNIICDYYLVFAKEIADTYDQDLTNETIQIIQNVPNAWTGD